MVVVEGWVGGIGIGIVMPAEGGIGKWMDECAMTQIPGLLLQCIQDAYSSLISSHPISSLSSHLISQSTTATVYALHDSQQTMHPAIHPSRNPVSHHPIPQPPTVQTTQTKAPLHASVHPLRDSTGDQDIATPNEVSTQLATLNVDVNLHTCQTTPPPPPPLHC